MIEFVCSEEKCFTCPLPDCVRESLISIKPRKIKFENGKVVRNKHKKQGIKKTESVSKSRREPLEDEKGKYYLRVGKNGKKYRQSIEAYEREQQRNKEYYQLRKNKERTAV